MNPYQSPFYRSYAPTFPDLPPNTPRNILNHGWSSEVPARPLIDTSEGQPPVEAVASSSGIRPRFPGIPFNELPPASMDFPQHNTGGWLLYGNRMFPRQTPPGFNPFNRTPGPRFNFFM
jgi:hypothetical protein